MFDRVVAQGEAIEAANAISSRSTKRRRLVRCEREFSEPFVDFSARDPSGRLQGGLIVVKVGDTLPADDSLVQGHRDHFGKPFDAD
jgi:hypothetical protein